MLYSAHMLIGCWNVDWCLQSDVMTNSSGANPTDPATRWEAYNNCIGVINSLHPLPATDEFFEFFFLFVGYCVGGDFVAGAARIAVTKGQGLVLPACMPATADTEAAAAGLRVPAEHPAPHSNILSFLAFPTPSPLLTSATLGAPCGSSDTG